MLPRTAKERRKNAADMAADPAEFSPLSIRIRKSGALYSEKVKSCKGGGKLPPPFSCIGAPPGGAFRLVRKQQVPRALRGGPLFFCTGPRPVVGRGIFLFYAVRISLESPWYTVRCDTVKSVPVLSDPMRMRSIFSTEELRNVWLPRYVSLNVLFAPSPVR